MKLVYDDGVYYVNVSKESFEEHLKMLPTLRCSLIDRIKYYYIDMGSVTMARHDTRLHDNGFFINQISYLPMCDNHKGFKVSDKIAESDVKREITGYTIYYDYDGIIGYFDGTTSWVKESNVK